MMAAPAKRRVTLGDLLGSLAGAHASLAPTDIVLDSRQVVRGAAFVALAGGREHGLRYAAEAFARGAAVVLYDPADARVEVGGPSVAVPGLRDRLGALANAFFALDPAPEIVGVTGTNGKTTVAYLLAQTLGGGTCAYVGTLGFGVPPVLTVHGLTTPDCLTLHRELALLGERHVAMEVSSHALAQDRIAGLAFHTAVFTNLTRDHLDAHGDLAAYGQAKARLFRRPELRSAVLNADDAFAAELASVLPPGCDVIRTSARGALEADLAADILSCDLAGLDLSIKGRFGAARLRSPLIGDFNAENLLCALGALLGSGVELRDACAALGGARPAPGRMEVFGGGAHPWVIVDYAHTPDGLRRTLKTLAPIARGRVSCVFGCGGERDRGKRAEMGAIAGEHADRIVLTDDNPRTEDPAAIIRDILAGLEARTDVLIEHDRERAIARAIQAADVGDVVLVAGKGHETEQVVGRERRAFDDRSVAARLLGSPT